MIEMIVERTSLYFYPLKSFNKKVHKFFHPNSTLRELYSSHLLTIQPIQTNSFDHRSAMVFALETGNYPCILARFNCSVMRGLVSDRDDRSKGQRETTALRSTLLARVKCAHVNASINT